MESSPPSDADEREEQRKRQRLDASKRGGEVVQHAFAGALTRREFARRVGLNVNTIRRWEAHGILRPSLIPILGIPTLDYQEEDVRSATEVARVIKGRPGELSLRQAAEVVLARRGQDLGRVGREGREPPHA